MLNKVNALWCSAIFIFLACLFSVFWYGRVTSNVVKAQTDSARLSLEISSSQKTFLVAEPISFDLKLANQTNQSIFYKGSLKGFTDFSYLVTNVAGEKSRINGNKYPHGQYRMFQVMEPRAKIEELSLIERDWAEELFPNPGKYDLQLEFRYDTDVPEKQQIKILSNSISINIVEPEGINRQAYEYIKGRINAVRQSSNYQAKIQIEQEFVDRHRNSVYAKYIIFNLAHTYQAMGDDRKALREFCKVSGEEFHYSKEVEKTVLKIDKKLNPIDWDKIPKDAPDPIIKHPCSGKILN